MIGELLAFARTNPLVGSLVIVAYLAWEIRRGRVASVTDTVDALSAVVIALAETHEDVDAERVEDALANGSQPSDFLQGMPEKPESRRESGETGGPG